MNTHHLLAVFIVTLSFLTQAKSAGDESEEVVSLLGSLDIHEHHKSASHKLSIRSLPPEKKEVVLTPTKLVADGVLYSGGTMVRACSLPQQLKARGITIPQVCPSHIRRTASTERLSISGQGPEIILKAQKILMICSTKTNKAGAEKLFLHIALFDNLEKYSAVIKGFVTDGGTIDGLPPENHLVYAHKVLCNAELSSLDLSKAGSIHSAIGDSTVVTGAAKGPIKHDGRVIITRYHGTMEMFLKELSLIESMEEKFEKAVAKHIKSTAPTPVKLIS